MKLDALYELSRDQALTATGVSTNDIDFKMDRDMGRGNQMVVAIVPSVAADVSNADETYTFSLLTDNDVAFGSPTTIMSTTIAGALLKVGATHVLPLPLSNERYLRLAVTLGGTTPSITFSAYLMQQNDLDAGSDKIYYASGYEV